MGLHAAKGKKLRTEAAAAISECKADNDTHFLSIYVHTYITHTYHVLADITAFLQMWCFLAFCSLFYCSFY